MQFGEDQGKNKRNGETEETDFFVILFSVTFCTERKIVAGPSLWIYLEHPKLYKQKHLKDEMYKETSILNVKTHWACTPVFHTGCES